MRKYLLPWCVLLVAAPLWAADPDVILPTPPTPPPPPVPAVTLTGNQVYAIQAKTAVTVVASPDGIVEVCKRTPPVTIDAVFWPATTATLTDFSDPTIKAVYLVRPKMAGTVEVICVGPTGGVTRIPITVGTPTPPTPNPPAPTDPLTKALQDAYASEMDAQKATKLATLVSYYGGIIAKEKAAGQPTFAALEADIHSGADVIAGVGGLPTLRKTISTYIAGKMPANSGPIAAADWVTLATVYGDVSKALGNVNVKGGK